MGSQHCCTDTQNQITVSIFASLVDGSWGGLGTSLGQTPGFKLPSAQLRRALGHPQTRTGKGSALAVASPKRHRRSAGQGTPRPLGTSPRRGRVVISAAGRLGLCSRRSPRHPGRISCPPHTSAALEEDSCTSADPDKPPLWAPRQCPGLHPQSRGASSPADLEQLCPGKTQPEKV